MGARVPGRGTRWRRALALLGLALVLTGCWDKLEMEDQIFVATLAVDRGERSRYRVAFRVPIATEMRVGILGGAGSGRGRTSELLVAEADTVAQAAFILNASVARRLTLRHLRGVVIGEDLAREGVHDLVAELLRNPEVRETAGIYVARGRAVEVLAGGRPTGEFNPGKVNEGLLLVEKSLYMAPPIRLLHLVIRSGAVGVDPIAPLVALNPRAMGTAAEGGWDASAAAGLGWGAEDGTRRGGAAQAAGGGQAGPDTAAGGFSEEGNAGPAGFSGGGSALAGIWTAWVRTPWIWREPPCSATPGWWAS